jgi:hypothetical protein
MDNSKEKPENKNDDKTIVYDGKTFPQKPSKVTIPPKKTTQAK